MDKLAKNQFILLLIRTILLQGTKLVFLLSLGIAAFSWLAVSRKYHLFFGERY